jgi:hypothetical protein
MPTSPEVLQVADIDQCAASDLLSRFGITLNRLQADADIDGSFWGAPEAGIVGTVVNVRDDTPVHSMLHEASHVICTEPAARARLHGDAGSDDLEEAAVCYLQILLATQLPDVGQERIMRDMDAWGYSFRLGATYDWFVHDADDARRWLLDHGIVDAGGTPCRVKRSKLPMSITG